jgi:DNA mismatch repair protein MutL
VGPEAGRELLALRDPREASDNTVALVAVTGLIGPPALHRATRNGIFLTVNRRPVDSRSLAYALEEAYATQLMVGRHPLAILDITVPAGEMDANVHPTKREVRLLRERLAFGALQRAVRTTLADAVGIPQLGETRGQLAGSL